MITICHDNGRTKTVVGIGHHCWTRHNVSVHVDCICYTCVKIYYLHVGVDKIYIHLYVNIHIYIHIYITKTIN